VGQAFYLNSNELSGFVQLRKADLSIGELKKQAKDLEQDFGELIENKVAFRSTLGNFHKAKDLNKILDLNKIPVTESILELIHNYIS